MSLGLIKNSYGNYVVQKSLKLSKGNDKKMLIQSIQSKYGEINDNKIRAKWQQIVQDAIDAGESPSHNVIDDNNKGENFGGSGHRHVLVK